MRNTSVQLPKCLLTGAAALLEEPSALPRTHLESVVGIIDRHQVVNHSRHIHVCHTRQRAARWVGTGRPAEHARVWQRVGAGCGGKEEAQQLACHRACYQTKTLPFSRVAALKGCQLLRRCRGSRGEQDQQQQERQQAAALAPRPGCG